MIKRRDYVGFPRHWFNRKILKLYSESIDKALLRSGLSESKSIAWFGRFVAKADGINCISYLKNRREIQVNTEG
ncbi:hypothetical protein VSU01S_34600 [Vibrio superstes NBRC 103154]|uniref:Uncharacterized protein n=1 Tax=Vibrio superstes NBRC 103154 TaxID=1219062 RepID=A0A511QV14_9VIBR|nr:hypothetical protein VSU01S_34600 [Vibrio superstes NBRC 103154]